MPTDRPVPASIYLELRDPHSRAEDFLYLPVEMFSAGLILERPREIRRSTTRPNLLEVIVTFVDERAMRTWLADPIILGYFEYYVLPLLRSRPIIARRRDLAHDLEDARVCACDAHSRLLLSGQLPLAEYKGFLTCGDCGSGIPAYLLPKDLDLASWSLDYRELYKIWLRSGPLSKWALNQLANYQSETNRHGRVLARAASKRYNAPVFYHLFIENPIDQIKCPNCHKNSRPAPWEKPDAPDRICARCKIAFFSD